MWRLNYRRGRHSIDTIRQWTTTSNVKGKKGGKNELHVRKKEKRREGWVDGRKEGKEIRNELEKKERTSSKKRRKELWQEGTLEEKR